jgi:hypothetical protein
MSEIDQKTVLRKSEYKAILLKLLNSKEDINFESLQLGDARRRTFRTLFTKKSIQHNKKKYIIIQYAFLLRTEKNELCFFHRRENKGKAARSLKNTNSVFMSVSPHKLDADIAITEITPKKINLQCRTEDVIPYCVIYDDSKNKKADYLFIVHEIPSIKIKNNDQLLSEYIDHIPKDENGNKPLSTVKCSGRSDRLILKVFSKGINSNKTTSIKDKGGEAILRKLDNILVNPDINIELPPQTEFLDYTRMATTIISKLALWTLKKESKE